MPFTFKTTATAAVLTCLMSGFSPAVAQVSPDIMNLLIVASKTEGGANLDIVANLAIAANPAAEEDIRKLVANLKQNAPEKGIAQLPAVTSAGDEAAEQAKAVPESAAAPAVAVKAAEQTTDFFNLRNWDGEAELNVLSTSGNTSQQSYGLAGKMTRDEDQIHHSIEAFFDLNKNTGVKDKQRYGLSYKLDYDFSDKIYVTSFTGYENDQFGTFRERITTSLGIGYPIIDSDSYSWKVEGGPSLLFTKEQSGEGYDSSFNAFVSSFFNWTINDRSHFSNETNFYFGNKSVIESKTALKVKINGALSSKFSYDFTHDQDAPVGRRKTDTIARAGLLYDF